MKRPNFTHTACATALICGSVFAAPVAITIDATASTKQVSPYIYGKNDGISQKAGESTSADTIQRYKDAGFKILRMNNGNNASKYNWEKHLTSHPDWYNNVYACNWDASASEIATKLPGVQGMYALSLLGWGANNNEHNFNEWLYNAGSWWSGVTNNWAGTPAISAAGETPTTEGDPNLYLEKRTSDQNVGILNHFFGSNTGELGLDPNQFLYWNMDNEPDIWNGTHDDVMPDTMSAEEFVQIYVDMALKARAKFPNIKLVGPVVTNEWQWYFWQGSSLISSGGKNYSYMEYFIKRIGEEQAKTGKRLLDVVDYHFYPQYTSISDKAKILQLHRVWFDTSYVFPKANAVKMAFGGTSKEFIFQRTRDWLNNYLGAGHGVTLGLSEAGAIEGAEKDASVIAAWYASQLGEFASQGDVELFTPWTQYQGMFEAVHLFTKYAKTKSFAAQNSTDHIISAYPTINGNADSMTVIIVNRDLTSEQQVQVSLNGFTHGGSWAPTFDLAYLNGETFKSESVNAIYKNAVDVSAGAFTITVPKTSVTAVVLSTVNPGTKPTFTARVLPSSSSSVITSSSSGSQVVVWDHTMGLQVTPPGGALSGWWYDYADPNSTVNALAAGDVTANQALHITYTAGTPTAESPYIYSGLGFSWNNTATGANIVTSDLSAYSAICVTYKSDVDLGTAIIQPDPANLTKKLNYAAAGALPVSATQTTVCIPWADFGAGASLNLAKQAGFQVEVGETADFTVYKVSLEKSTSSIKPIAIKPNKLNAIVRGRTLLLKTGHIPASTASLMSITGQLVQQWNLQKNQATYSLDLAPIKAGRYILNVPGIGTQSILIYAK